MNLTGLYIRTIKLYLAIKKGAVCTTTPFCVYSFFVTEPVPYQTAPCLLMQCVCL